jgi:5'-nucleotidase
VRILISNDDGIYSPGIAALAEVASEFGTVRIVAPDAERSSMGHAITSSYPLAHRQVTIGDFDAYRVNGTPADCVALGVHLWDKVDVVLSGINLGLNLGNGIWHSGTVAAAKQATLLNLPGIALSGPATLEPDFGPMKPWVRRVLQTVLPIRSLSFLNINIPRNPQGMVWTRVSVRKYDGQIVPTEHPLGRQMFWFTVAPVHGADEGTDRWALEHDLISITPLSLDLTNEHDLEEARRYHPLDEAALTAAVSAPKAPAAAVQSVREDEADSAHG